MTLSGLHICSDIFLLWKPTLLNWIVRWLYWIYLIRKMVLKMTFNDKTRNCGRKQWAKQPQWKINITARLRWRLLGSGIETHAIYCKSIVILEVPQRTELRQFSLSKVNPIQLAKLNLHISFKCQYWIEATNYFRKCTQIYMCNATEEPNEINKEVLIIND